MSDALGKWLVILGYCSVLYVLVRPNSQGPQFVEGVGTSMASVINASTGGGTF